MAPRHASSRYGCVSKSVRHPSFDIGVIVIFALTASAVIGGFALVIARSIAVSGRNKQYWKCVEFSSRIQ